MSTVRFRSLCEIERVLAPGGLAVVTFPFFADRETTVRRSSIVNGAVMNLPPPEYHGNPLVGGSLVFSEFGWDFLQEALASIPGSGSSNRSAVKGEVQSFQPMFDRMPGTGSSTRSMQSDRRRMGFVGEIFLCSLRILPKDRQLLPAARNDLIRVPAGTARRVL